jgi:O-antigen ligase
VLAFIAFGAMARWKKLVAGAIALLMLLAIALSQSRGALLLGVPAALIVMSYVAGGRWRKLSIVGGVLIADMYAMRWLPARVFGVLLSGAAQSALAGTRFANALDLNRGTGFFRIQLWQSAWNMFLDHPLLGVGPDNFLYAYRGRYILPAAWQEPNLSHPHNFFFDLFSRLGAAGLFAFVLIVAGAMRTWRAAWRTADHDARALLIGCAGVWAAIFAHGLVDHSLFNVDLAFIFMLTCGFVAALPAERYKK